MKIFTKPILRTMPLLAATGAVGLASVAAAFPDEDREVVLQTAWTPENAWNPANGATGRPAPSVRRAGAGTGGIAGGTPAACDPGGVEDQCIWDNGNPTDCGGAPGAQRDDDTDGDGSGVFLAEVADDFMFVGDDDPCEITCLTFWVSQFNVPAGTDPLDPATGWEGVQVTIYAGDNQDLDADADLLEPARAPLDPPGGVGMSGHTGHVMAVQAVPIASIGVTLEQCTGQAGLEDAFLNQAPVYRIDVPLSIVVPKNFTMWFAISPWANAGPQVAILLSDRNTGAPATQHFVAAGLLDWTPIGGSSDACVGGGPFGTAPATCPYDCDRGPPNITGCPAPSGAVDTVDLLELLAQWGNLDNTCDVLKTDNPPGSGNFTGVDTSDLLGLLAAFSAGTCPAADPITDIAFRIEGRKATPTVAGPAPNNPCASATDVNPGLSFDLNGVGTGTEVVELNSATNQPPGFNPFCLTDVPLPDIWYEFTAPEPGALTLSANVDSFIEVYDGTACPPSGLGLAVCGPAGPLLPPVNTFVGSGQTFLFRVLNHLRVPDSVYLTGSLDILFEPGSENQECDAGEALTVDTPIDRNICSSSGGNFGPGCPAGQFIQDAAGLWYEVVGPGPGNVELTAVLTQPLDDPWDGIISVYCGDCTLLGCMDITCIGSCQTFGLAGCEDASAGGFTATVGPWCSAEGEVYRILVHPTADSECDVADAGDFTLEVITGGACGSPVFCGTPAPDNDDCIDETDLGTVGATSICVEYDTTCATTDGPINPNGVCNDFGAECTEHDIWYTVEIGVGGALVATTCTDRDPTATAAYDTDIVIYGPYASAASIDCGDLENNLADCNDDDLDFTCGSCTACSSSPQVFGVQPGEVYLVRVGGWGGADEVACNNGDFGLGTVCLFVQDEPTGACCVTGACTDDVLLTDCIECGATFFEAETCANVTCPEFPATCPGGDPYIAGNADHVIGGPGTNGLRPAGGVGGWGSTGIIDDFCVTDPVTVDEFTSQWIDQVSANGAADPTWAAMEVRIYDVTAAGGSLGNLDPLTDVPIFTVCIPNAAVVKTHLGTEFSGDVDQYTASLGGVVLPAGTYGLWVSFFADATCTTPYGDQTVFWANTPDGGTNGTSPEQDGVFGINGVDGTAVFWGPSQDASFCVGGP